MSIFALGRTGHAARLGALGGLFVVVTLGRAAGVAAATDPRFFGTYCGTGHVSVVVKFLFFFSQRRTVDVAVRASVKHTLGSGDVGLLTGDGTAAAEEKTIPFVLAGRVEGAGQSTIAVTASGYDRISGSAVLQGDGDHLIVFGTGRSFTLSKTGCGNEAPTVALSMRGGASTDCRASQTIEATVSDRQDPVFSPEQLVWTIDGVEVGIGRTLTRELLPGSRITLTATDSGGLIGQASVVAPTRNCPPDQPIILSPAAGASFYAGQIIEFQGRASDPNEGDLGGASLTWRSGNETIGSGAELQTVLPAGSHSLVLEARDAQGLTSSSRPRQITVRPQPKGNEPPRVRIVQPSGIASVTPPTCVTLVAEAVDHEEGPLGAGQVRWTRTLDLPTAERTEVIGTGSRVTSCHYPRITQPVWAVFTVTATDRFGLEASDSVRVRIYPIGPSRGGT